MASAAVRFAFVLLIVPLLAACAASLPAATAVRFHQNFEPRPARIALRPADPALARSLEFAGYANQIGARLEALGFQPATGEAPAELIGEIAYTSSRRSGMEGRSPIQIGIGGGSFGNHVGVSAGTTFGLGEKASGDILTHQLAVRLLTPDGAATLWEGRASVDRADDPQGALTTVMPVLIEALFSQFPGQSGMTTTYKPSSRP